MIALLFVAAAALTQPVRLENHFTPHIDRSDSGDTVRYELQIVNDGSQLLKLQSLRVQDADSEAPLLTLSGDSLKAAMAQTPPGCDREHATVASHAHCVVYIDGALKADKNPSALKNTLEFTADRQPAHVALKLPLASAPVPVIGPPLGNGIWVAVHSPDWPRGHRRMFYKAGDREVVPGRFAIDFVKVSPSGGTSTGNPDKPADTIGYGDPVLAVVTGRIAAVRDGVAESSSIRNNGARERSLAAGNYIVLALGSGLYATYEHLQPRSIRVREGDQVRQGDVIAALGFTGDSTGPHLHFHVSNTIDPLGGEGLPYAFDRFTLMGDYPDIAQLGARRWDERPATEIRGKRPGVNSVLSFK